MSQTTEGGSAQAAWVPCRLATILRLETLAQGLIVRHDTLDQAIGDQATCAKTANVCAISHTATGFSRSGPGARDPIPHDMRSLSAMN